MNFNLGIFTREFLKVCVLFDNESNSEDYFSIYDINIFKSSSYFFTELHKKIFINPRELKNINVFLREEVENLEILGNSEILHLNLFIKMPITKIFFDQVQSNEIFFDSKNIYDFIMSGIYSVLKRQRKNIKQVIYKLENISLHEIFINNGFKDIDITRKKILIQNCKNEFWDAYRYYTKYNESLNLLIDNNIEYEQNETLPQNSEIFPEFYSKRSAEYFFYIKKFAIFSEKHFIFDFNNPQISEIAQKTNNKTILRANIKNTNLCFLIFELNLRLDFFLDMQQEMCNFIHNIPQKINVNIYKAPLEINNSYTTALDLIFKTNISNQKNIDSILLHPRCLISTCNIIPFSNSKTLIVFEFKKNRFFVFGLLTRFFLDNLESMLNDKNSYANAIINFCVKFDINFGIEQYTLTEFLYFESLPSKLRIDNMVGVCCIEPIITFTKASTFSIDKIEKSIFCLDLEIINTNNRFDFDVENIIARNSFKDTGEFIVDNKKIWKLHVEKCNICLILSFLYEKYYIIFFSDNNREKCMDYYGSLKQENKSQIKIDSLQSLFHSYFEIIRITNSIFDIIFLDCFKISSNMNNDITSNFIFERRKISYTLYVENAHIDQKNSDLSLAMNFYFSNCIFNSFGLILDIKYDVRDVILINCQGKILLLFNKISIIEFGLEMNTHLAIEVRNKINRKFLLIKMPGKPDLNYEYDII